MINDNFFNLNQKYFFSFLSNNVFVAANEHNTKKKKTGFILYSPDFPPLNSRVKYKQVFNLFSMLCLIASIKNIKQNIRENIVQCWFYETIIKILRLIRNTQLKFQC